MDRRKEEKEMMIEENKQKKAEGLLTLNSHCPQRNIKNILKGVIQ
jgi:hypothetical protein